MARKEGRVSRIARLTSKRFPSLSTPAGTEFGVTRASVEQIVRFVLTTRNRLDRTERDKIGDDARDYVNTSDFLRPLSDKALGEIKHMGRGDIHRRLKEKTYPFSRLNKKTREILLHLPNSWVHGAANWLLNARKLKRADPQVIILAD